MAAPRTAKKWADRFRAESAAGMGSTAAPHVGPAKTSQQVIRRIVDIRWRKPAGSGADRRVARRAGLHGARRAVTRCRIDRLSYIDRVTGEPLRRYEHDHPGSLIHVDVTKFANISDGGGHKLLSRQLSHRNAIRTAQR